MAFKRPSASLIMLKMPSIIKKIVSIIKPLNRITLCPRKDSISLRMLSFYNYDMQNMLIVVTIQCVFFPPSLTFQVIALVCIALLRYYDLSFGGEQFHASTRDRYLLGVITIGGMILVTLPVLVAYIFGSETSPTLVFTLFLPRT